MSLGFSPPRIRMARQRSARRLYAVANAPIFSFHDTLLVCAVVLLQSGNRLANLHA
jgi:hypothetical protein